MYHKWETIYKLKILGFAMGKQPNIKPMTEDDAINLSADMLGEIVIFSMAALTVWLEYRRQSKKEKAREELQNSRLGALEKSIESLNIALEAQNQKLEALLKGNNGSSGESSLDERKSIANIPETIVDTNSGTVLLVQNSKNIS